jgi:hypothetical protein
MPQLGQKFASDQLQQRGQNLNLKLPLSYVLETYYVTRLCIDLEPK